MVKHRKIVLTVLICCYNAGKFLDRCLGSLVKQSIPSSFYKILFINDASTDESLKIAESYKMDLKIYRF